MRKLTRALCLLAANALLLGGLLALSPAATAVPVRAPTLTPSLAATAAPHARTHPDTLEAYVSGQAAAPGMTAGVTLVELAGDAPVSWSYHGGDLFDAASTYKLPLLMDDAQEITSGVESGGDQVCYEDGDQEDGPYDDYADGGCFTRSELDGRVGRASDNTAAHMLVRTMGGGSRLNAYATAHGADDPEFYDPNLTTSDNLARLLVDEARGNAGGVAAKRYLYPLLTDTDYESGIPAGVPSGHQVVHKVGFNGGDVDDVGLVLDGPRGPYVLAVCVSGPDEDSGWGLVAAISGAVWRYEAAA